MIRVSGRINEQVLITDEAIGPRANWREIFGNDRPVQIEIGPGKGTVLLHLARVFANHNFLGIEWARAFYRYAGRRMTYWNVDNVRMLRTDAREFVVDRVGSQSLLAVHAYFPDPWPKKRHQKRRLFIPEFCAALGRVLVPGGKVLFATDHEEYFARSRENLLAVKTFRESDPNELAGRSLEGIESNYQAKFAKEGRTIYRLAVEKV